MMNRIGMPLLIVAGEKDLVTEFKYTQELFNKVIAPEKKLKTYPDGRHELINDIEYNDVVDSVVAWTNETLAKHTPEPQCRPSLPQVPSADSTNSPPTPTTTCGETEPSSSLSAS